MKERSLAQVDGDHGSINADVFFFADEIDAPVAGFNTSTPNSHEPNISAIGKCHVTQMCLGLIVNDHVIGNGHVIGKEHVQISQTFAHTQTTHWIYSCGTLADARSDVALHLKVFRKELASWKMRNMYIYIYVLIIYIYIHIESMILYSCYLCL